MKHRILMIGLAILFLAGLPVQAHRAHLALTEMLWVEEKGTFEITHQLHYHDSELAVQEITLDRSQHVVELEGQARLLLYINDAFKVWVGESAEGFPLQMELVGAELVGDMIHFYMETPRMERPESLTIHNGIFVDIYRQQENQLNVNVGGDISSLTFRSGDGTKTLFLP